MISSDSRFIPLTAGAFAGLSVDIIFFPIDTIKTRMQSQAGFLKSGGLRGIYSGLFAVGVGAAPNAAVFFLTYDRIQRLLQRQDTLPCSKMASHLIAASCGEMTACLIRVPTEVVKQRAQATQLNTMKVFGNTILEEGIRGLFRGYLITITREIPFAAIQFPLWEYLKERWSHHKSLSQLDFWRSGLCGFVAGGVAAGVTTPLDVVKTRIMLASVNNPLSSGKFLLAFRQIFHERGLAGFFAGIAPRMTMISCGGFIFLGAYDFIRNVILNFTDD